MAEENKSEDKSTNKSHLDNFTEIFTTFGAAMSEIFNDPELKKKAGEFTDTAKDSAKTLADRLKDEDVKNKFRDVGKAAEEFGKSISDIFESKK